MYVKTRREFINAFGMVRKFWRRYKRNRAAVAALVILIFFMFVAVLAPLISPYDPWQIDKITKLSPPSAKHPMGTDELGRDILSRTINGSRASLFIGLLAAATSTVIGVLIGAISGYYGGIIDTLAMRITELFQTIPRIFLLLILAALFGPSIWNIVFAIGILSWPSTARLLRAEFMRLREYEFVEAARSLGDKDVSIVFSEILPNALAPVIVNTSFQVAGAILLEAGLSFLGLGDPEVISWGVMMYYGRDLIRTAWWLTVFPGLALFVVSLGFNVFGDGLNDALNPRLRKR